MHRALFDDSDSKLNIVAEPFSISRNLVQRKQEGNNMEINKMFDAKTKLDKDGIDLISLPATDIGTVERFNHFTTANESRINRQPEKRNNRSLCDFLKSFFRCSAAKVGNKKINEQIESNYPLNLHLRMNEIFSMHDKLSDIAENLNDLYSAGDSPEKFEKGSDKRREK